ncbi:ATP-binding cassette domain-containing protein [Lysinibacillus sp. FN11]|uniref:ATP-binding cassette domain-containing protein n=1 Tax=Lysinibacillus TaxID=400634 RepID=UPI0035A34F09
MLILENLSFSRNQKEIFQQFQLQIAPQTVTCILGSSGIGKTTLLRLIAKFISPDSGLISSPTRSLGMFFRSHVFFLVSPYLKILHGSVRQLMWNG